MNVKPSPYAPGAHRPSTPNSIAHHPFRLASLPSRPVVRARSSSSENYVSSVQNLHQKRRELSDILKACIQTEDYSRAAEVKKQLEELEAADPILQLQKALDVAVKEERYKDAATIQQQIAMAQQSQATTASSASPPVVAPPPTPAQLATLDTSSDLLTHGVRVMVRSFFLPQHSSPSNDQYLFGYHVTIINQSDRVVQLKSRHWVISDANGRREDVRGAGVVGHQPVLLPGKKFEYQSCCPLTTPQGCMEGSYQFVVLDESDGRFKDMMDIIVARFKLSTEGPVGM